MGRFSTFALVGHCRKSTGITSFNNGSVLFKCPSKPVTRVQESGNIGRTKMQTVEMAESFQWFNNERLSGRRRQAGRQVQVQIKVRVTRQDSNIATRTNWQRNKRSGPVYGESD